MNKLLAVGLSLPLVACVIGSGTDPGDDTGPTGNPGGMTSTAGHISSSTTWSGLMEVTQQTTVDAGVTLTIAAGTTVKFGESASIVVNGLVDIQGTKASVVTLAPAVAGGRHGGFSVQPTGEVKMTYGVQTGGGYTLYGGKVTVTDSLMSKGEGTDFLRVETGTLDVSYSQVGLEPGSGPDTTHCDLHFQGAATTIKVTHSNIMTAPYGLMLYGGNVNVTYNNWLGNDDDVNTQPGVAGDISFGYFAKGAPLATAGATLIANNLATDRLPAGTADGAGPR